MNKFLDILAYTIIGATALICVVIIPVVAMGWDAYGYLVGLAILGLCVSYALFWASHRVG